MLVPQIRNASKRRRVADILMFKNGGSTARDRKIVEGWGRKVMNCHGPYVDELTGRRMYLPRCHARICPWCRTERTAAENNIVLYDQFARYAPEEQGRDQSRALYEIRVSLGRGNVSGRRLGSAIDHMVDLWNQLTRLIIWSAAIEKTGGQLHERWQLATKDSPRGFLVHLHLVCLPVDGNEPPFEDIAEVLREKLSLPKRTPRDAYFHCQEVEHLGKTAMYITHVRNLIPGYPKKPDDPWLLEVMPDADILAFLDATAYRQTILNRGFNPEVEKVSRRNYRRGRR